MTLVNTCWHCGKKCTPPKYCRPSCRTAAWIKQNPERFKAISKASRKKIQELRKGVAESLWRAELEKESKIPKTCYHCQKEFFSPFRTKLYCSAKCTAGASRRRRIARGLPSHASKPWVSKQIKCRWCGNPFLMKHPRERPRYCCLEHSRLASKRHEKRRIKELYKVGNHYWMARKFRNTIRLAIKRQSKNNKKLGKTAALLGCTFDEARRHLQSKFKDGMSWDNYGYRGWHIDHIRPCDSFDLSRAEEQMKCFHYTNLQPLWWRDNIKKHAKWNPSN